jgi:hypothetical protein
VRIAGVTLSEWEQLTLFIAIFWGVTTAGIASGKARSPVLWFFVGFATGLIGIIIVLCLSSRAKVGVRRAGGDWGRW